MSKIIDITDKLKFKAKPKIKIKGAEIEINNGAMTMLELMDAFSEKPKNQAIKIAFELLFNEDGRKCIKSLELDYQDFETFIMATANAVINGDDEETEGETQTPATT